MLGLRALRVASNTVLLPKFRKVLTTGQQLVNITLVPSVPNDRVARRVKDPVNGDRGLHHAKVWPKVTASLRDRLNQILANLLA